MCQAGKAICECKQLTGLKGDSLFPDYQMLDAGVE
jgi:hypothetical protein